MQIYSSKLFKFTLCLASTLYLAGCEKAKAPTAISYQSAEVSIKEANQLLSPQAADSKHVILPFTEAYLEKRHVTYELIDTTLLNETQLDELNYLKIQERYPERYIMWPAHVDVLKNAAQLNIDKQAIENWLAEVAAKLEEAKESKIALSRIELSKLKSYLNSEPKGAALLSYLQDYKPRSGIGLYQLPNGKEWYQSKLNFYYTKAIAPRELLNSVQQSLSDKFVDASEEADRLIEQGDNIALAMAQMRCQPEKGLNWLDGYTNLPATLAHCELRLSKYEQALVLALMEVDLGIHYQGWSLKQSQVTLQSRLELTDKQAYELIEGIALHPASILSFLPKI